MFPLAVWFIGEFGKKKHAEHLVVATVIGSVEELCGLAKPAHQPDSAGQFFTNLTHQRLFRSFAWQRTATRQADPTCRSPHSGDRAVLTSDNPIGSWPFGVRHSFQSSAERQGFTHGRFFPPTAVNTCDPTIDGRALRQRP